MESKQFQIKSLGVDPTLTDKYQLTMAFSYFKQGRHNEQSVFDTFFRKCPFKGEVPNSYIFQLE